MLLFDGSTRRNRYRAIACSTHRTRPGVYARTARRIDTSIRLRSIDKGLPFVRRSGLLSGSCSSSNSSSRRRRRRQRRWCQCLCQLRQDDFRFGSRYWDRRISRLHFGRDERFGESTGQFWQAKLLWFVRRRLVRTLQREAVGRWSCR